MCQILDYKIEKTWSAFQTIAVRTSTLTYDVYTNDRFHGLCFPTVIIDKPKFCSDLVSQKILLRENREKKSLMNINRFTVFYFVHLL